MVFQDNNIGSTIRNEKYRRTMDVYSNRVFIAKGGYPTYALSLVFGVAGCYAAGGSFGLYLNATRQFNGPLLAAATGGLLAGYFIGTQVGLSLMGNREEHKNLKRHGGIYSSELSRFQRQFYNLH